MAELVELELGGAGAGPGAGAVAGAGVARVPLGRHTYDEFFHSYLARNRPCVVTGVTAGWSCRERWRDCARLAAECGELRAPVSECGAGAGAAPAHMSLAQYAAYLSGADGQREAGRLLYLKDWHLRRARPLDRFYSVPDYFASDWLNEYALDEDEDDFMFVYIGPAGSWTPLHVDVYSSYSWSVNVIGRKRWLLFPPGEENKLKDSYGKLLLQYNKENCRSDVVCYEIIQEAGDAIFVPTGWHHEVHNMLDTISINHNWINGCNIFHVWTSLKYNMTLVQKEIEEFKHTEDYDQQCQLILKSYYGMNYEGFLRFLLHIAKKRLSQAMGERHLLFEKYVLGVRHLKFDLCAISKVLDDIMSDGTISKIIPDVNLNKSLIEIKRNIEIKLGDSTF